MGTAQVPGGVGAGLTEPDGTAAHLAIEVVQGRHQSLAAFPLRSALGRVEQEELLAVGVDQIN